MIFAQNDLSERAPARRVSRRKQLRARRCLAGMEQLEERRVMATSIFQEGVDSGYGVYTGAKDIQLYQAGANTSYPRGTDSGNTRLLVDYPNANNAGHVLLRFDNIFGSGAGQIPLGAKILSASVIVDTSNPGDGGMFHRMLLPWSDTTDTWNAFGSNSNGRNGVGGIQADNVEAVVGYGGHAGNTGLNNDTVLGSTQIVVTNDLQAWANGETNNGWAILPWTDGTGGWAITPSEDAVLNSRPKLVVDWLPPETALATFRQGVNGYTGAVDTDVRQASAGTARGTADVLSVDATDGGNNEIHALIRFDNIIGDGPGQIPAGSTIQYAYLDLVSYTSNSQGDGGQFFRMLTGWTNSDTWNSFGTGAQRNTTPGIQSDGLEAATSANTVAGTAARTPDVPSGFNSFNVSVDLQAWVNGEANHGWAMLPWTGGSDGWIFGSSEAAEHLRPQLRVVYTPPLVEPPGNTVDVTDGELKFAGGQGLANNLTVSLAGGNYTLTDSSGPITLTAAALAAGWSSDGMHTVTGPSTSVNSLNISTGNNADNVFIQGFDDALTVHGGGGANDTIHFLAPFTASANLTITQFGAIDVAAGVVLDLGENNLVIDALQGIGSAAQPLRVTAASIVAYGKEAGVFITETDGADFIATAAANGEIRLATLSGTLRVNGTTTTDAGNITLSSGDDVVINAQVGDLGTFGRIYIAANTDGAGNQGYLQTPNGMLGTNNTSNQAIVIEVNTAQGGAGDAVLAPALTAGDYVVNARGGSVLWNPSFAIPPFNGGNTSTLKANNYSFTSTSPNGSIGTLTSPIQTDNLSDSSRASLNAGAGGIFLTDWGALDLNIAQAIASGAGDVQLVSANAGGHNLKIVGPVTTGSGNIRIFADDSLNISGQIGGSGFSGEVHLKGNVDTGNEQRVTFEPGSRVTTTNTGPNAILIEAFPTNPAGATNPGGIVLDGDIQAGNGGTITLNAAAGTVAARSGAIIWNSGVIDAGAAGTVVLTTRHYFIGSPGYGVQVNAGHVIASSVPAAGVVILEAPHIAIVALNAAAFTVTTGSGASGTTPLHGSIELQTLSGILTVEGPINTDAGTIQLTGAGGVIVSGPIGDDNTTGNVTITAATGDIVFTVPTTIAGFAMTLNEAGRAELGPSTIVNSSLNAASGVEIGAGDVLSGTGTVNAPVHVLAGGTITPGNAGPGTLTLNSTTLAEGAFFSTPITSNVAGIGYGQFVSTGTLDLAGATLQAPIDYVANIGDSFTIVRNDGPAIVGQFAQGTSYQAGPYLVGIDYAGGDGNDIVLTITGFASNNTAPVLDNTGNMVLPGIGQGQKNNPGALIGELIVSAGGDRITDADAGALEGLAIVAADTTSGTWEYTTDGTQWLPLGDVNTTTARLLADDGVTRIRFVPNTSFNGTVTEGITFRAWDQTFGLNGGQVDVTNNGGIWPFSTATETASIAVAALPSWYLNEVMIDAPSNDGPKEYFELRGTPGAAIPQGYYWVLVDGDDATTGQVQGFVDLGGLSFGANGYLVVGQNIGNYANVSPYATIVSSTGSWLTMPRFSGTTTSGDLPNGAFTAFLIYTSAPMVLNADIDTNNDGVADGSTWNGWEVLDSVGTTDGRATATTAVSYAYGRLNFVDASAGGQAPTGTTVNVTFAATANIGIGYMARTGDTTGSSASDWVGVRGNFSAPSANTPPFSFVLPSTAAENTQPSLYGARLNHLGSSNFVVNEPPVITPPAAQTVDEDFELIFSTATGNAITVADVDAAASSLQVTLTVTNGVLTLAATNGLTITGNTSAVVTLSGTLADINAALDGLKYQPTLNFNDDDSLKVDVLDVHMAADSETIAIAINPVNDAPNFILTGDPLASLQDAGPQTVPAFTTGMTAGPADEANQTLTFLVVASGTTGNLAFSAGPAIDPLTGELTYTAAPGTSGTATFNVVLADSDSGIEPNINISVTRTFTITVTAVTPSNQPPVNTLPAAPTTNEDTNLPLSGISIADPDAGAASLRTTVSLPAGVGVLHITAEGGATITGNGTTSIQIDGTIAAINATLATLIYQPLTDFNGDTQLTVVTNDLGNTGLGGELLDTDVLNITIVAINDAPTFVLPANPPASQQDAGAQTVNNFVTQVSAGPANETGQTLTFQVTASGTTGTLSFSAAPAIDPLTGTLSYTAAAGTSGTATFNVVLVDNNDSTAPNVNTSVIRTFTITVNAATPSNQPPVNSLPTAPTTNEDTNLPLVGITVSDPDAGTASMRTTVSLPSGVGVLTIAAQNGATVTGSGTTSIIINGSITAINATLATLVYQPASNFHGATTLTIVTSDLGNTGVGGALTDTDTLTINITPVNDPPTFNPLGTPPASQQDAGLQIVPNFATGMSAGPPNEVGQPLSFLVTQISGSGLTFTTAPTINAVTGELRYQASSGTSGAATFSVVLNDGQANSLARVFTITVTDTTYGVEIVGPETTVRGMPTDFIFSATTSAANAGNPIRYEIDWNGDGRVDQTIVGDASGIDVSRVFPTEGQVSIIVEATDLVTGVSAASEHELTVTIFGLVENEEGGFDAVIGGTIFADRISLTLMYSGAIQAKIGTKSYILPDADGKIIIYGLDGNDTISVAANVPYNTAIYGGAGNDYIAGGIYDDYLDGGDGADRLLGGNGNNSYNGGAGNDVLSGRGGNEIMFGGDGNDNISGGGGDDIIDGGAGNDILNGLSGNDIIRGGSGTDVIRGDVGHDILIGGDGNDTIYGAAGRDILIGGGQADQLRGGSDDDILIGGKTWYDEDDGEEINNDFLRAALLEWLRPQSISQRVAAMYEEYFSGVIDNDLNARDTLYGDQDSDWFLVHLPDVVSGKTALDIRTDLS